MTVLVAVMADRAVKNRTMRTANNGVEGIVIPNSAAVITSAATAMALHCSSPVGGSAHAAAWELVACGYRQANSAQHHRDDH